MAEREICTPRFWPCSCGTLRKLTLCLGLTAALVGCAHYTPLPLAQQADLPEQLPDIAATALTPDAVATLAVQRNPDLRAARLRRGVAQAKLLGAGIVPNPILSGAILPLLSGAGSVAGWNVGIAQDLKAIILRPSRQRAARDDIGQVAADLLWQEWQVAAQARMLASDIVARDAQRPMLVQAQDLFAQRCAKMKNAVADHQVTLTALAPDTAACQNARDSLQALDQAQLQARHQLNALMGLAPQARLILTPSPPQVRFDTDAVRAQIQELPQRRPDLLALRFGYASQDETLRGAILAQFPDFILGSSVSSDNSKVISGGPDVSLGLPLFDRNQGNIAAARATRAQLAAEYAARLAAATGEVIALADEWDQANRQRVAVEADLPVVRQAARRAQTAFAQGLLDERSYVDLVSAGFAKEQEIMTLQQQQADRRIAIEALLGIGLPLVETRDLPTPAPVAAPVESVR